MANELLENLDRLHTTELGVIRIKKNLSLNVENVIEWCKEKISLSNAEIIRKGKIFPFLIISALERLIFSLHHSITFSTFKDKFFLILITPSSVV